MSPWKAPVIRGRCWLVLLALASLTLLVMLRLASLRALLATLAEGEGWWVLGAAGAQGVYFGLYALLYRHGFAAVGLARRFCELVPLVFASLFVNAVTGSAGVGGAALFIDDAIRRGQPGARAAVGVVLSAAADLVTMLPFILAGVGALFLHRELELLGLIGGGVFLLYTLLLCGALLLAGSRPLRLRQLLQRTVRIINRVGVWFRRPALLTQEWADRTARLSAEAATTIPTSPQGLAVILGTGFMLHAVHLGGLVLLFPAFRQPVEVPALLAGFALGLVSSVIALIPQGAGTVEGAMALVFVSLGIPPARAFVIILAFRGLNFWLPLLAGFILLRGTRSFGAGGGAPTGHPPPARPQTVNQARRPAEPRRRDWRPGAAADAGRGAWNGA